MSSSAGSSDDIPVIVSEEKPSSSHDPDYHSALNFFLGSEEVTYSNVTSSLESESQLLPSSPKRSPLHRVLGLSFVLCASFLFSGTATAAKYLHSISPGQFVIVRGGMGMMFLFSSSFYSGTSLISFPKKPLVALRCISHGFGYTLKIWCVKNMNIGDAISIYFTSVIFAGIYSRIFLKEKYTLVNAASVVFGFAGVFLIAKPSFIFKSSIDGYDPLYCLVALSAACCTGIGYTSQRAIGPGVGAAVTPFYTNLWVVIGGISANYVSGDQYVVPGCYDERIILFACSAAACVALVVLNIGLSIEKSASATIMRNMDIVLAFVVQVFLFKEQADWLCILGAGLIVTSAVSVTMENAFCPQFFCQI